MKIIVTFIELGTNKLQACKLIKESKTCGLHEAKAIIDSIYDFSSNSFEIENEIILNMINLYEDPTLGIHLAYIKLQFSDIGYEVDARLIDFDTESIEYSLDKTDNHLFKI